MVKWFTYISRFMLAFTQLQALTGPEGSSQCLSGLLAFTMARSVTNHSWMQFANVYHVQIPNPTASTALARRANAVLVRLACVHQGQVHNRTPSTAWARRAHAVLVSLACGHHSQIHNLLGACEPLFKLCFFKFYDKILKNLNFMFYPLNQISSKNALKFLSQLKIL